MRPCAQAGRLVQTCIMQAVLPQGDQGAPASVAKLDSCTASEHNPAPSPCMLGRAIQGCSCRELLLRAVKDLVQ